MSAIGAKWLHRQVVGVDSGGVAIVRDISARKREHRRDTGNVQVRARALETNLSREVTYGEDLFSHLAKHRSRISPSQ